MVMVVITRLLQRFRDWKCRTGRHKFDQTPVLTVDGYSTLLQLKCECRHCNTIVWRPYEQA